MKIAIDFDGTIYDTEKEMRVAGEIYDIEKVHGKGMVDRNQMWSENRYNWTDEENSNFVKSFVELTKKSNVMPGAKEVIEKIQKMGAEIILVTARGYEPNEDNAGMIEIAKEKLEADNFHFSKYYFKMLNKSQICLDENVDFIIDDSPDVCQETINNNIKTIFLRDSEVNDVKEPNEYLYEVENWGEIYRIIYDYIHK